MEIDESPELTALENAQYSPSACSVFSSVAQAARISARGRKRSDAWSEDLEFVTKIRDTGFQLFELPEYAKNCPEPFLEFSCFFTNTQFNVTSFTLDDYFGATLEISKIPVNSAEIVEWVYVGTTYADTEEEAKRNCIDGGVEFLCDKLGQSNRMSNIIYLLFFNQDTPSVIQRSAKSPPLNLTDNYDAFVKHGKLRAYLMRMHDHPKLYAFRIDGFFSDKAKDFAKNFLRHWNIPPTRVKVYARNEGRKTFLCFYKTRRFILEQAVSTATAVKGSSESGFEQELSMEIESLAGGRVEDLVSGKGKERPPTVGKSRLDFSVSSSESYGVEHSTKKVLQKKSASSAPVETSTPAEVSVPVLETISLPLETPTPAVASSAPPLEAPLEASVPPVELFADAYLENSFTAGTISQDKSDALLPTPPSRISRKRSSLSTSSSSRFPLLGSRPVASAEPPRVPATPPSPPAIRTVAVKPNVPAAPVVHAVPTVPPIDPRLKGYKPVFDFDLDAMNPNAMLLLKKTPFLLFSQDNSFKDSPARFLLLSCCFSEMRYEVKTFQEKTSKWEASLMIVHCFDSQKIVQVGSGYGSSKILAKRKCIDHCTQYLVYLLKDLPDRTLTEEQYIRRFQTASFSRDKFIEYRQLADLDHGSLERNVYLRRLVLQLCRDASSYALRISGQLPVGAKLAGQKLLGSIPQLGSLGVNVHCCNSNPPCLLFFKDRRRIFRETPPESGDSKLEQPSLKDGFFDGIEFTYEKAKMNSSVEILESLRQRGFRLFSDNIQLMMNFPKRYLELSCIFSDCRYTVTTADEGLSSKFGDEKYRTSLTIFSNASSDRTGVEIGSASAETEAKARIKAISHCLQFLAVFLTKRLKKLCFMRSGEYLKLAPVLFDDSPVLMVKHLRLDDSVTEVERDLLRKECQSCFQKFTESLELAALKIRGDPLGTVIRALSIPECYSVTRDPFSGTYFCFRSASALISGINDRGKINGRFWEFDSEDMKFNYEPDNMCDSRKVVKELEQRGFRFLYWSMELLFKFPERYMQLCCIFSGCRYTVTTVDEESCSEPLALDLDLDLELDIRYKSSVRIFRSDSHLPDSAGVEIGFAYARSFAESSRIAVLQCLQFLAEVLRKASCIKYPLLLRTIPESSPHILVRTEPYTRNDIEAAIEKLKKDHNLFALIIKGWSGIKMDEEKTFVNMKTTKKKIAGLQISYSDVIIVYKSRTDLVTQHGDQSTRVAELAVPQKDRTATNKVPPSQRKTRSPPEDEDFKPFKFDNLDEPKQTIFSSKECKVVFSKFKQIERTQKIKDWF